MTEAATQTTAEKSKKEEKRERILKAAGQLFIQNGYANTRIIDIAKAADVAKGTVYEYFSSKDALVVEWVREVAEEIGEITAKALSGGNAEEKLEKYIQVKIQTFVAMKPLLKLFVERGHEATCDEKANIFAALMALVDSEGKIIIDILKSGIAEGYFRKNLDVDAATALILSNVIMFTLYSNRPADVPESVSGPLSGSIGSAPEVKVESVLDMILNGLKEKK